MRFATGWTCVSAEPELLAIESLAIRYPGSVPPVAALRGVDLALAAGRRLGLVGESGAGKSQLALAIPGLLPPGALVSGQVRFRGEDLNAASPARLRALRGAAIGFVFQDPQAALTPHLRIGTQLIEALRAHESVSAAAARERARRMLERVQVPDAARRLDQYPHELSGGLRQRVVIAMALIASPALIIADEPTTALDVTVEADILALFRTLTTELGTALLLISHDLAVVASLCDDIAVLYAGRIVESGSAATVLGTPAHPYTAALAAATPTLDGPADQPLAAIPGSAPAFGEESAGCAFAPRCPRAVARCRVERPLLAPGPAGTRVACHYPLGGAA
jgi:oligopeptide/dipeptide ABC transporter ATP-binding protein